MTPERLTHLRSLIELCEYHDDGNDTVACTCAEPLDARPFIDELLTYVDELTVQRDDARRIAIDSGVFQDHRGEDYDMDSERGNPEWRADPVGPVAWDGPATGIIPEHPRPCSTCDQAQSPGRSSM